MTLRLAVVSTSRSDLGHLLPIVRAAQADPRFAVELIITGTHLAEGTPGDDEIAGTPAIRLPRPADSLGLVHQVALRDRVRGAGCVLVLGDRVELLELACALVHASVPIAHCSGGERTLGAWDDLVRDAMTRLAHLHYPSHEPAAERLRQMGEEAWRILATGEPGLDDIVRAPRLAPERIAALVGAAPAAGDILVAVHPVTRDPAEVAAILDAVEHLGRRHRLFLSSPNGDPGSDLIRARWRALTAQGGHVAFENHGAEAFRSIAAGCGLVVGNSSAGLLEAPSLGATTVDVGTRQKGRLRGPSVVTLEVPSGEALIQAAARARALIARPEENPYGDGRAVAKLLDHLHRHATRPGLLVKS